MSKIILKTAKRKTTVSRTVIRRAVISAYGRNSSSLKNGSPVIRKTRRRITAKKVN